MAYLQIKSTNPELSYVLSKNPATGMLGKSVRLGTGFGWFSPGREDTYNCFFKDADTEVSYKAFADEKFEYLNTTRYNSLLCYLNLITDFFGSTVTKDIEQDVEGFENQIMLNLADVKDRYLKIFRLVFPDFNIEDDVITPNARRITIKTNRKIRDLLNYTNLFCLFNVMANDREYLDVNDDIIGKYMKFLDHLEAPFYVKYVFKINLLRKPSLFKKYKELLETTYEGSNEEIIEVVPGNTDMHRWENISSRVNFEKHIIDLGCGEGNYIRVLAKKQAKFEPTPKYYAIDKDPAELSKAQHKVRKYRLEHVEFFDAYAGKNKDTKTFVDDAEYPNGCEMVMVEVIEHIPLDEAKELLSMVSDNLSISKYHITTPNVLFNPFYQIPDGEFRHDDHDFELTPDEFKDIINTAFTSNIFDVEFYDIGDKVNGQPSTLGCEVRRK